MQGILFTLAMVSFMVVLSNCNSDFTPKPRAHFKIDLPEKKYQLFDQPGYPYSFEYPVYASVSKDTSFFDTRLATTGSTSISRVLMGGFMFLIRM